MGLNVKVEDIKKNADEKFADQLNGAIVKVEEFLSQLKK